MLELLPLTINATRRAVGRSSCSKSSSLSRKLPGSKAVTPVALPPGRARLSTSLFRRGSLDGKTSPRDQTVHAARRMEKKIHFPADHGVCLLCRDSVGGFIHYSVTTRVRRLRTNLRKSKPVGSANSTSSRRKSRPVSFSISPAASMASLRAASRSAVQSGRSLPS